MFRKTMLALVASVAVGAAALAPTSASAGWGHGGGGWGHGGWGHHWGYGGGYYVGYDSCWRTRWVDTPYGLVLRRVNVCY